VFESGIYKFSKVLTSRVFCFLFISFVQIQTFLLKTSRLFHFRKSVPCSHPLSQNISATPI